MNQALLAGALGLAVALAQADPYPGWTLYDSFNDTQVSLVDLDGQIAHTWDTGYTPGAWLYMLDDGTLLRTEKDLDLPGPNAGGAGGRIQMIAWDGTVTWDYVLADTGIRQHHDLEPLPNGNFLAVVWESKTRAEAQAMGRVGSGDPEVWSEAIYEIRPTGPTTGEVVWSWHVWDHLVQNVDPNLPNYGEPSDHPERIDINYVPSTINFDWLHFNSVDYNPELDQIIVSCHSFSELWVFSHAPGASGDLLYRWGNPLAYGMGTAADQKLFKQHDPHWIKPGLDGAGDILIFNNGVARPEGAYSSVDQITPPLNPDGTYHREPGQPFGPDALTWTCDNIGGEPFYSGFISGSQRLPNGDTLICVGATGEFYEVTPDCGVDWSYVPTGLQFRAERIGVRDTRLRGLLWCPADIAEPYETLDLADVVAFIEGYLDQNPLSDLADPRGTWDTADVQAFVDTFLANCP
ncbi:MAG: aryl-sulfate sulfotransferase [Phycisphaeraceae bacterium]|nr:MAG: aryl-sulfate sulfotransferase [Phycisphaeraceae bacterium]